MATTRVTADVMLLLVIVLTEGRTAPSLYATTNFAVPGTAFTVVCTWNISESYETDIYWSRKGTDNVTTKEYVFHSDTCELEKSHNGSYNSSHVSARYGLLYQSLIFTSLTESDIWDTWDCSFLKSNRSNYIEIKNTTRIVGENVRMSSTSDVVYTGSTINLTCSHVFNSSYFPVTWLIDNVKYTLGENCSIRLNDTKPDDLNIVNRSLTNCSQDGHVTLTLTNVSLADHDVTWVCSILRNVSIAYRVIVLDPPDLPDNVTVTSQSDTGHEADWLTLICSTPCEEEFNFVWGFPGNTTAVNHNSCDHICSQTLTVHVGEDDNGTQVNCTVANPRTGSTRTAGTQIVISSGNPNNDTWTSWTTTPLPHMSDVVPVYVWVAATGGGVVFIVIVVIVVVVCRRGTASRPTKVTITNKQSTKPVMENNALYETAGPGTYTQDDTHENKLVMEDNILYAGGENTYQSHYHTNDEGAMTRTLQTFNA